MGFDNDCIVNLQSLPGEYFCPVCRTLVYPDEALQSQCTHLYCKPCLAYIVSSTQACPYDGYLVTVADSRPLVESNKLLADTIGKVAVRCLYCRSGCQWQGALSDCITHCTDCNFGNSPVICNRCTTQVLHRQVQEHGQTCAGMQAQAQQVEGQAQDSKTEGQPVAQDQPLVVSAAPATAAASTAPSTAATATSASLPSTTAAVAASVQGQPQVNAVANPQTAVHAQPHEQWYQQQQLQYQQYFQQFPGYDPYQQQYQQYAQYQQQIHPQYAQMQAVPQQATQGYRQPAPYMMQQPHPQHHPHPHQLQLLPQSQPQPQPQTQPQLLPQSQPQPQPQPQSHSHPQPQPQPQLQPQSQSQSQSQPQAQAQPQPQARPVSQPQQIQVTQPQFHHQYPPQSQTQTQLQIQAHAQQLQAPVQQPHLQAQPQTNLPPHAQLAGKQPLQPPPHPRHPQPQSHHQLQPSNLQAPPPQPPHSQVQQPQSHLQQQALIQSHPQPQHQLPPSQPQPNPTPQHQSFPHPQPQPQHPSAQAIPGHQYYPQPQPVQQSPSTPQQRPMQVHPQHPIQVQNQFPPQQIPQMRPPYAQLPMQASQTMMPPQGPHANLLPNQQQAQHAVHQQGQHILQHPSMQPHAQQQGLPQQQGHAQLHPGHPQQQETYPSQPLTHPQQPLRAQGPPYVQQQGPVQPRLQQNVMSALPNHQVQNMSGRPMMPNSGMPQQPYNQTLITSTMPKQVHVNHQASNQNHHASDTTHLPPSSDLPHGSVQQNQLTHPGSQQSTSLSTPPALQSGIQINTLANALIKQTESAEPKSQQSGNDSKYAENVEAPVVDANVEIMPNNDGKDNRESAEKVPEKYLELQAKDENDKEPVLKPLVVVEASESITDIPDTPKPAAESKGLQNPDEPSGLGEKIDQHQSPDTTAGSQSRLDSNMVVKTELLGSVADIGNANSVSQGQISENITENMHAPQHLNHQYELHKPPGPDQAGYTMHHSSNEHAPKMPNPELVPQRPPAPDKMFPQHMPNPDLHQERNFMHPPNHQIQVHGQVLAPTQYRPPVGNFSATFPHQGLPAISQEPFLTPMGKPPHGPYRSEMPSSAMVPGPFGLPEEQTQNQMPQSHAVEPRKFQGEPLGRPSMGGPLPGPRRPAFGIGDQMGRPANSMEAEGYAVKGPNFNGWQCERDHPISIEHVPFGQPHVVQSNPVTMNRTHGAIGGVHESDLPKARFASVPDEKFKPFAEPGFMARPEEQFRPSTMDPATRIVSQFEEDLKRFPRPTHLDRAGMHTFDGYMSSKRPLDSVPQPFGLDAVQRPLDRFPYMTDGDSTLTPLSSYRSGGRFPPNTGGSTVNPMDIGDRLRPVGPHEDSGRDHEISSGHPNHRTDCLPPLRNPGGEYTGIRTGRFGLDNQSHMDDFGNRVLHGFGDRSKAFNLPSVSVGRSLPAILRAGDPVGPGQLHDGETTGFGGIHSHLRAGDPSGGPGNLRSHVHIGEQNGMGNLTGRMDAQPGYGGRYDFPDGTKHFDSVFSHGGMNSFEHARMRKSGSMGWCRICKIDCGTVEDLDMHSQTREHQNMSMDMVLSIKRESAKKQKLTSGGILSHEDASKVRKMNFESRATRM